MTNETDLAVLSNKIKNLVEKTETQTKSIDKLTEAFTELKAVQSQVTQQQTQVAEIFKLIREEATKLDVVKDKFNTKIEETNISFNEIFTNFSKRVLYYVLSEGVLIAGIVILYVWRHW